METTPKNQRPSPRKKPVRHAVVDVVILLLAVVALAGIFFRWVFETTGEERDYQEKTYIVSVEIEESHKTTLDSLRAADSIYLSDDTYLGYLTAKPVVTLRLIDGELPTRAVATARMSCEGKLSEDGTLTMSSTGLSLTPGSELSVRTDRALLTIRVLKIEPKS